MNFAILNLLKVRSGLWQVWQSQVGICAFSSVTFPSSSPDVVLPKQAGISLEAHWPWGYPPGTTPCSGLGTSVLTPSFPLELGSQGWPALWWLFWCEDNTAAWNIFGEFRGKKIKWVPATQWTNLWENGKDLHNFNFTARQNLQG